MKRLISASVKKYWLFIGLILKKKKIKLQLISFCFSDPGLEAGGDGNPVPAPAASERGRRQGQFPMPGRYYFIYGPIFNLLSPHILILPLKVIY